MPFATEFIEQGRGLVLTGSGLITARDIHDVKTALLAQESLLRQVAYAIVDLKAVTELKLTAAELRGLVKLDLHLAKLLPHAAVAIVAAADHPFGMARMWEVLAEDTGWQTAVFRTRAQAEAWVNRTVRQIPNTDTNPL